MWDSCVHSSVPITLSSSSPPLCYYPCCLLLLLSLPPGLCPCSSLLLSVPAPPSCSLSLLLSPGLCPCSFLLVVLSSSSVVSVSGALEESLIKTGGGKKKKRIEEPCWEQRALEPLRDALEPHQYSRTLPRAPGSWISSGSRPVALE